MKKLILPLLLLLAAAAFGQLDPTPWHGATFDLYESGNKVGEIFVPARPAQTIHYLEHWVLYPNYVYPGANNLTSLKVVPKSTSHYRDVDDFFRRVPFDKGSKYIRVTSDEFTALPQVR